jgi:peptidoglycan/LPS O-acetylase OafA/YrhL
MHIMLGRFTLIYPMSSVLYSKYSIQRHSAQNHLIRRNHDIDLLRSLAILYLIIFGLLSDDVITISSFRVIESDFLFYISLGILCFSSGYLLSDRYHFSDIRQIFLFYCHRLTKLYPFYWITLTIFLILDMIPLQTYLNSLLTTHIVYVESLEILWLVSLILNLYLLFPLFAYHYHFGRILIILSAFYMVSWSIFDDLSIDFENSKLILFLPVFVLGSVVARHQFLRYWMYHRFVSMISILMIIILSRFYDKIFLENSILANLAPTIIAISGIPFLYAIAHFMRSIFQEIQRLNCYPKIITKIINFTGYSLFSTYLLHRIVLNAGLEIYHPPNDLKTLLYLGMGLLPTTVLIAYGYQRSIDYIVSKF